MAKATASSASPSTPTSAAVITSTFGKLGRDHSHQRGILRAAAGDDQLIDGTTREDEAAACFGDRARGECGDGRDQIVVNDFHAAGVGDDAIEQVWAELLAAG